jgi:hypothetical protein
MISKANPISVKRPKIIRILPINGREDRTYPIDAGKCVSKIKRWAGKWKYE